MQVVVPLLTYREQFQDIKGRIDKCEARRVEFDRCAMELTNISIIHPGLHSWPKKWRQLLLQIDLRLQGTHLH